MHYRCGLFRNSVFESFKHEAIKKRVESRELQLVVATDAACEGLNLQTLDTLLNNDLPWNPSRMRDKYDIFGGNPDCIDDDGIDDLEAYERLAETHLHLRLQTSNIFEATWGETVEASSAIWDNCSKVLSRQHIDQVMSKP